MPPASSNKPTAVHFSLVTFVMISAVCGFMWYVAAKDLNLREAELRKAQQDSKEDKALASKYLGERDILRDKIGHKFDVMGVPGTDDVGKNATVIIGAIERDFDQYSPEARKDYTSALQKLADDIRNVRQERDDLRSRLNDLEKNYLDLQARESTKLAEQKKAVDKAEGDIRDLITKKDEVLTAKQREVEGLNTKVREVQSDLENERQAHLKEAKELRQTIDNQVVLLRRLNEEMDALKRTSFEVGKGIVRYVDHTAHLVWINLGADDRLRTRTTFSVYEKSNQGMARGPEDIKGAIEVTRILGPHMAEARITKSDIYRPMAAGDPIYTPLWSPAGTEKFAMVGFIDLDNDKHSDRDALYTVIKAAGAEVAAEVSERGVRTGIIDQDIKFLVLGKIPKLDEAENKEQRDEFQKLYKEYDVMKKEAKENGVRIITLSDFATYIGYVRQSKLFRPGDKPVDQLNAGAHSTTLNADPGQRRSPGKVSDLFEKKNKSAYHPPVSAGQTSKLFKGGGSGK